MGSAFSNGLQFLINTLFTLYSFVLLVRVLLPAVQADYYNPFSQFIIKLTQPILGPCQKILPHTDRFDTAAIVVLWLFICIKIWVVLGLLLSTQLSLLGVALFAIAQILELLIQFYFFAIIIQAILSWVQPNHYNPFVTILSQLNEPLLAPFRRHVPSIAGLDLSPLLALIALQLLSIMLINPFAFFALQLTVGVIR